MKWGTAVCALVLLLGVARSDDEKAAKAKEAKAGELAQGSDELWGKFVQDRNSCSDEELQQMLDNYDAAIELYDEAAELRDSAAGNSSLLVLARRTATIRATLFMREMRRKAEAVEREKKENPTPPEKEPEPEPEPEPRAEPEPDRTDPPEGEADPEFDATDPSKFAMEITETDKERSANIRRARRFVFDRYFRYMKKGVIRNRCPTCRGHGTILVRRVQGKQVFREKVECTTCRGKQYSLHLGAARYANWLTRSPLARNSPECREEYEKWVEHYREHAVELLPIDRLSITNVDYRGLWAIVEWEETRRKEKTTVRRTLVRLGRNWYFYSPQHDAVLLMRE